MRIAIWNHPWIDPSETVKSIVKRYPNHVGVSSDMSYHMVYQHTASDTEYMDAIRASIDEYVDAFKAVIDKLSDRQNYVLPNSPTEIANIATILHHVGLLDADKTQEVYKFCQDACEKIDLIVVTVPNEAEEALIAENESDFTGEIVGYIDGLRAMTVKTYQQDYTAIPFLPTSTPAIIDVPSDYVLAELSGIMGDDGKVYDDNVDAELTQKVINLLGSTINEKISADEEKNS